MVDRDRMVVTLLSGDNSAEEQQRSQECEVENVPYLDSWGYTCVPVDNYGEL